MNILILGAAGFIGTNLTIELSKNLDDCITLVDKNKNFFSTIEHMNLKNVCIKEADFAYDMDFDLILKKSLTLTYKPQNIELLMQVIHRTYILIMG